MNNETIRIKTYFSPRIENLVKSKEISNDDVFSYLSTIKQFYQDKNYLIFLMPSSLIQNLYASRKLKTYIESILKNRESKIILTSIVNIHCTNNEKVVKSICANIYSEYINYNIPFVIDTIEGTFDKECGGNCNQLFCKSYRKILLTSIDTDSFRETSKAMQKEWIFTRAHLTNRSIKNLLLVLGILFGANYTEISKIETLCITDALINDMSGFNKDTVKKICYSIARSVYFPSAHTANYHEYSIDYHLHGQFSKYKEHTIFRLDCMGENKKGVKGSGKERIFFSEYGGKRFYLAYSDNHEIRKEKLKSRIDAICLSKDRI